MALSHTFVLNLKLERLCLAKKILKDCGSSTRPGESPRGGAINSFCISNNIPYAAFYDWFKKTQKKVVPVEVEGIPEDFISTSKKQEDAANDQPKRRFPHKGSIMVTIRTREGLCIQKKGLDYQGLKTLVEKLWRAYAEHQRPVNSLTSAESNLNFEVLKKISSNLGIDISSLETKKNLLDLIVLARRNECAHGEFVYCESNYGLEVANAVLDFMKSFKDLLQNMIAMQDFRLKN